MVTRAWRGAARSCKAVGTMTALRTISLWQPFASLIFARKKKHDTRSFRAIARHDGERLVIHAAKKMLPDELLTPELHALCVETFGPDYRETLPRGVLLGTVELGYCRSSSDIRHTLDADDFAAGDWTDGRYGWELRNPQALPSPISAKGQQGWWSTDPQLLNQET